MKVLTFSITLALSLNCSRSLAPDFTIDYQIHSNNDLRELRCLLLKDSRSFKFDPHYLNKNACKLINNIEDPRGCLLLNHDTPIPGGTYNTTNELLSFFTTSKEYTSLNISSQHIDISLCFKSAPDFCQTDSLAFNNWLQLIDEFYNKVLSYQGDKTNPQLQNIEIILDGNGKPISCLIGRWPKWNSVWINSDSPSEAFYSNKYENDYYRFQILNDPTSVSNWTWMADVDYGKFSNSSYSYQIWEPDSQSDYNQYINIYESGKIHPAGYKFAINVDSCSMTGRAANGLLNGNFTSRAIMSIYPTTTTINNDAVLIIFYNDVSNTFEYLTTYVDNQNSVVNILSSPKETLPNDFILSDNDEYIHLSVLNYKLFSFNNPFVLVSQLGTIIVQATSLEKKEVIVTVDEILIGSFISSEIGKIYEIIILSEFQKSDDDSLLILLLHKSLSISKKKQGKQTIYLSKAIIRQSTDHVKQLDINIIVSQPIDSFSDKDKISSVRMVNLNKKSIMVFLSINDVIISTIFQTPLSKSQIFDSTIPSWVILSVGRHISLNNRQGILTVVNDNGYCYNSHDHNTRSFPTVCSSKPKAMSTVLDYSIGKIDEWVNLINFSINSSCVIISDIMNINIESVNCFLLSSCSGNNNILHGSYDQGSSPQVLIVSGPSINENIYNTENDIYFIEVHDGLPSNIDIQNSCGEPLHRDGLVINAMPISSWIDNLP